MAPLWRYSSLGVFLVAIGFVLVLVSPMVALGSTSKVKDRRGDVKICGKKASSPWIDITKATARFTKDGKIVHVIRVAKRSRLGDADLQLKMPGDKEPRYRINGFGQFGYALLLDLRRPDPNEAAVRINGYSKRGGKSFRYKFDPRLIGNPKKYRWRASTWPGGPGDCRGAIGDDAPNKDKPFKLQSLRIPEPSLIKITSGPKGKTPERNPTFSFVSPEADTSFQCRLNKRKWSSCTSPKSYAKLAPGKYTFKVKGSSPGGSLGGPASRSFVIEGNELPVKTIRFRGGKGMMTLTCPQPEKCQGMIEIEKGKSALVKKQSYSIAANGKKKIRLRLTKAGNVALARSKQVRAIGTLTGKSGKKSRFVAILK